MVVAERMKLAGSGVGLGLMMENMVRRREAEGVEEEGGAGGWCGRLGGDVYHRARKRVRRAAAERGRMCAGAAM